MNIAYISLGSNLGDREQSLKTAIEEISSLGSVSASSKIYETEPYGYKNQNNFLNQVIKLETEFDAINLIVRLQEIEHRMGKKTEFKNGPRNIDIDILYFNREIIQEENLKIPHPGVSKRNFILTPLNDIASDFIDPQENKTINELLKNSQMHLTVKSWT